MGTLDSKAVVITGAGNGLGAAYARHVASLGAAVVVNDLDQEAAAGTVAAIKAAGGRAIVHAGDASNWAFCEELIATCVSQLGTITGLVNNAAVLLHSRGEDLTEDHLRRMIDVNLIGTAACGHHAIRAMQTLGTRGTIVNVCSGSQAGDVALGAYGATKAGVAALTYTWALELRGSNITVNAISPLADTAMSQSNSDFMEAQSAEREVVYGTLPAADVNAPVVGYLLSDDARAIHGQIVRIAGDELSFATHPMIADPVLKGHWTDSTLRDAFRDILNDKQQKLGLTYEPKRN